MYLTQHFIRAQDVISSIWILQQNKHVKPGIQVSLLKVLDRGLNREQNHASLIEDHQVEFTKTWYELISNQGHLIDLAKWHDRSALFAILDVTKYCLKKITLRARLDSDLNQFLS